MTTIVTPGDTLTIATATEGPIGSILIKRSTVDGHIVGELTLTNSSNSAAIAAFQAADEAADAFAFAAMELEEANLAALGLRLELPNGNTWVLGKDIGNLLVTENCAHIAFRTLNEPKIYETR